MQRRRRAAGGGFALVAEDVAQCRDGGFTGAQEAGRGGWGLLRHRARAPAGSSPMIPRGRNTVTPTKIAPSAYSHTSGNAAVK